MPDAKRRTEAAELLRFLIHHPGVWLFMPGSPSFAPAADLARVHLVDLKPVPWGDLTLYAANVRRGGER